MKSLVNIPKITNDFYFILLPCKDVSVKCAPPFKVEQPGVNFLETISGGFYETVQRSGQSMAGRGMGKERKKQMGVCPGIRVALPNVQHVDPSC
jgi:hypothetical protein